MSHVRTVTTTLGGAGKKSKRGRDREASKPAPTPEIPLGRYLASTEKSVRDGAIKSLAAFLATPPPGTAAGTPIAPDAMSKLWKGIFYCYWLSDKPFIQQALAQELADMVLLVPSTSGQEDSNDVIASSSKSSPNSQAALAFVDGFWVAMVREWTGLDKYRIDKFYMLMRRMLNAAFRLLAAGGWEQAAVSQFSEQLGGLLLLPNEPKVPASLVYHLCDIFLDELERAISSTLSDEDTAAADLPTPLLSLMAPFTRLAARTRSKEIWKRIWENVIGAACDDLRKETRRRTAQARRESSAKRRKETNKSQGKRREDDEEDDLSEEDEAHPAIVRTACPVSGKSSPRELHESLLRALFEEASKTEAAEARRRVIYDLWREWEDEED